MERSDLASALQEWRAAQQALDATTDGDRLALQTEVERARGLFHQMSADHMIELLDTIHEAESRRQHAVPSTPAFHQAAKDEMSIASEIWSYARMSDEDTPKSKT